jgi:hypothetical protein
MKLIYTLLLAVLLFPISGCGNKEITGQIFVVTKGKDNIKLALVEVGAIPQEEFDKYLKVKHSKKIEEQKRLLPQYEQATKQLKEAGEKKSAASDEWSESGYSNAKYRLSLKADENFDLVNRKTKDVISEFEAFNEYGYYLQTLPAPKFISKTDADGKFFLTLPKGKYAITASSSRNVGSTSEAYHWLVVVDTASDTKSLMLSNDNFVETNCNECVKLE